MLYAKLAKRDPCRIVCGACGNGLAWVTLSISGHEKLTEDDLKPSTPPRPVTRYVLIPEGWFPDAEGVWRPSQRARRQIQRGLPVENRRRPAFDVKFWRERGGLKRKEDDSLYRSGFLLMVLPSDVKCIYCHMRQTLDAEMLDATTFAFSSGDPAEVQAEMVKMGPRPRRGFYPGAFAMPYRLIQDKQSKRWTALSMLGEKYLGYQS